MPNNNFPSKQRKRAQNSTFQDFGIKVGSTLKLHNRAEECTTLDDKNGVKYNGGIYTISKLAMQLLDRQSANGFDCFEYKGTIIKNMPRV